eukprot:CAMPEP_0171060340 /NCGR_PEP_ID=MMETSP0766_2-20121228/3770_1 /TAXON_ID=439317 /ORGANISM="Gambierdiscus australes, Strain CAWD 149" /LENGTH=570 /DNA_ID=CAMNT_0011515905 /DNA_START=1 /DNA_END=1713 /DNA_ORIENTATION=-
MHTSQSARWRSVLLRISMFFPFFTPSQVLPHVGETIYDRVPRTLYFCTEMGLLLLVAILLLETARFLCSLPCRRSISSLELQSPLSSTSLSSNTSRPARIRGLAYSAAFVLYYILYQSFLWVLMDYGVANGLMNLTTGIAWELWLPFVEIIAITCLATGIPWYLMQVGRACEHPAPQVGMLVAPWLGNDPHIFKDHIAQALCFATAHCHTGALRAIALLLGGLSIAATFLPLAFFFVDSTGFKSLRAAHWPIPEAPAPGPDPTYRSRRERLFFKANGVGVSAVTPDKYVRAVLGEAPHTALHLTFAYFFGGGTFILAAIGLSTLKVFLIPVGRLLLKGTIPKYGCSEVNLQKFLDCCESLGWKNSDEAILMATRYRWGDALASLKVYVPDLESLLATRGDEEETSEGSGPPLLNKLLQAAVAAGGMHPENGDADPAMGILRTLRFRLGVCDPTWSVILINLVSAGAPPSYLAFLTEIDGISGSKNSIDYIQELLRHDIPEHVKTALKAYLGSLRLNCYPERSAVLDGSAEAKVYAMIHLHARRVIIVTYLMCLVLPVLSYGCARRLATFA